MKGMSSMWIYSGYNSKKGFGYTHEWNFEPGFFVVAQAGLHGVSGEGLHHCGIVSYRHRPDPKGAEIPVHLGEWPTWAGYIYVNNATSVTFGSAVGARQELYMWGNLYFW